MACPWQHDRPICRDLVAIACRLPCLLGIASRRAVQFHLHSNYLLGLLHTSDQTLGTAVCAHPALSCFMRSFALQGVLILRYPLSTSAVDDQKEKRENGLFQEKSKGNPDKSSLSWLCLVVHVRLRPEKGGLCPRPNPDEPYIAAWKLERV